MSYPKLKVRQLPSLHGASQPFVTLSVNQPLQPWCNPASVSLAPIKCNNSYTQNVTFYSPKTAAPYLYDYRADGSFTLNKPILGIEQIGGAQPRLINTTPEMDAAFKHLLDYPGATLWGAPWTETKEELPKDVLKDLKTGDAAEIPFILGLMLAFSSKGFSAGEVVEVPAFFYGRQNCAVNSVMGPFSPKSMIVYRNTLPESSLAWIDLIVKVAKTQPEKYALALEGLEKTVSRVRIVHFTMTSTIHVLTNYLLALLPANPGLFSFTCSYLKPLTAKLQEKGTLDSEGIPTTLLILGVEPEHFIPVVPKSVQPLLISEGLYPAETKFYSTGTGSQVINPLTPDRASLSLLRVKGITSSQDLVAMGLDMNSNAFMPLAYDAPTDEFYFDRLKVENPEVLAKHPNLVECKVPIDKLLPNRTIKAIREASSQGPYIKLEDVPVLTPYLTKLKKATTDNFTLEVTLIGDFRYKLTENEDARIFRTLLKESGITHFPVRYKNGPAILTLDANVPKLKLFLDDKQSAEMTVMFPAEGWNRKLCLDHLKCEVLSVTSGHVTVKRMNPILYPGDAAWAEYIRRRNLLQTIVSYNGMGKFYTNKEISTTWHTDDLTPLTRLFKLLDMKQEGIYTLATESHSAPPITIEDTNLAAFKSEIANWVLRNCAETVVVLRENWRFVPQKFHLPEAKNHDSFKQLVKALLTQQSYATPVAMIRAIKALCADKDIEQIVIEVLTTECKMNMHEVVYVLYS